VGVLWAVERGGEQALVLVEPGAVLALAGSNPTAPAEPCRALHAALRSRPESSEARETLGSAVLAPLG
jgi:hypothetical protein